jgi:hypothetical protein
VTKPTLAELGEIADNAFHSPHSLRGNRYAWQAATAAILKRLAEAGEAKAWAGRAFKDMPSTSELRAIAAEAGEVEE